MSKAKKTTSTIIPVIRYHHAPKAIDWLCKAFGFEKKLIIPDEQGGIAHAQLVFGNGMIMVGTAKNDVIGNFLRPPGNGPNSQCPFVIVEDPDEHYQQAVDAGATILREVQDEEYGGRGYTCRDPEGNIWTFGSYDPWQQE